MQEIRSSNPPVVTGICDPNKYQARHYCSLKLGLKLKYLKNDVTNVKTRKTKQKKLNLTKEEKTATEEVTEGTNIIITNADKGGAVVIMNTDDYINEVNGQLSDEDSYKQLPNDPTLQSHEMVYNTIERFQKENLLLKKTAKGLKIFNSKTPIFYIKPKIHKENNPRRPVINPINCQTSEISCFVDHYLQPVVTEIPSYIIDTNGFIKNINNLTVPKDSIQTLWMSTFTYQHSESRRYSCCKKEV